VSDDPPLRTEDWSVDVLRKRRDNTRRYCLLLCVTAQIYMCVSDKADMLPG